MTDRAPKPLTIVLLIGVLCSIWGTTYFVIRESLDDLPPLHAAAWRFSLAAIVFTAIAPKVHGFEGGKSPSLQLSLAMGTLVGGIPYGLVYWSEVHVPSGLASVLWGTFPMMMAVGAHFLLDDEPLTLRASLGLLLGFAGVVSLFFTDLRALGANVVGAGAILLLSPLTATLGQGLIKRGGAGVSSVLLNRNGAYISAAILWAGALILESDREPVWSPSALASVVYLGLVATVIAFGLYFWLLRYAPLGQMAMIAYIVPALALLVGAGVGGEPIGNSTLAGTAAILAGVAVVTRARQRVRRDARGS